MVQLKRLRLGLRLGAILLLNNSLLWAAESVISKVPDSTGKFCHLKFPAIKEETLYWDRPVLKDPSQGDIIDFYGSCNHDPLGKEEIQRQRDDYVRRQRRLPESEGA
jgi:hypothetical protein